MGLKKPKKSKIIEIIYLRLIKGKYVIFPMPIQKPKYIQRGFDL